MAKVADGTETARKSMAKPKQKELFNKESDSWLLNVHITKFVNAVFGRKGRPSLAMYDAILSAEEAGYSHDDMRLAFWVARCLPGDEWLAKNLHMDGAKLDPELVLRHHGHINPKTGNPAKRWLDHLTSRADETNPMLVGAVLRKLPPDMIDGERELLQRMKVALEER